MLYQISMQNIYSPSHRSNNLKTKSKFTQKNNFGKTAESNTKLSTNLHRAYCSKQISFKGTPERLPSRIINNTQDALKQWELLRFAKYSDATTDKTQPSNKKIRLENYSFLEKLTSWHDKKSFITAFKDFTGFPNLSETSNKILGEFKRAIHKTSNILNNQYGNCNPADILMAGYDSTCSVGHKMALPGSDLDKGFAIIRGTDEYSNDTYLSENFKGHLWDEIDQRILSVNHMDSFPNIHTQNEVLRHLSDFSNVIDIGDNFNYFMNLRLYSTDPIQGSHYNRLLAEALPDGKKEKAKNFAYLIETIRDGKLIENNEFFHEEVLGPKMEKSQFAWCSNVAQIKALDNQAYYSGTKKDKIEQRKKLQSEFDFYDIDKQYDIVKNIIKASSGDQSPEYSNILGSSAPLRETPSTPSEELMQTFLHGESNDIGSRRLKLNDILTGKIGYLFDGDKEHFFYGDKFFEN